VPPLPFPRSAEDSSHGHRERGRKPEFYAPALDQADRSDLTDAATVAGLDQEIAVLRLRLRRLLREQPDELVLIVRTIELLVRAVGTAARLSGGDPNTQLERITAGMDGMISLLIKPSDDVEPTESPAPGKELKP
jgi:hypothetical protein